MATRMMDYTIDSCAGELHVESFSRVYGFCLTPLVITAKISVKCLLPFTLLTPIHGLIAMFKHSTNNPLIIYP